MRNMAGERQRRLDRRVDWPSTEDGVVEIRNDGSLAEGLAAFLEVVTAP